MFQVIINNIGVWCLDLLNQTELQPSIYSYLAPGILFRLFSMSRLQNQGQSKINIDSTNCRFISSTVHKNLFTFFHNHVSHRIVQTGMTSGMKGALGRYAR